MKQSFIFLFLCIFFQNIFLFSQEKSESFLEKTKNFCNEIRLKEINYLAITPVVFLSLISLYLFKKNRMLQQEKKESEVKILNLQQEKNELNLSLQKTSKDLESNILVLQEEKREKTEQEKKYFSDKNLKRIIVQNIAVLAHELGIQSIDSVEIQQKIEEVQSSCNEKDLELIKLAKKQASEIPILPNDMDSEYFDGDEKECKKYVEFARHSELIHAEMQNLLNKKQKLILLENLVKNDS